MTSKNSTELLRGNHLSRKDIYEMIISRIRVIYMHLWREFLSLQVGQISEEQNKRQFCVTTWKKHH